MKAKKVALLMVIATLAMGTVGAVSVLADPPAKGGEQFGGGPSGQDFGGEMPQAPDRQNFSGEMPQAPSGQDFNGEASTDQSFNGEAPADQNSNSNTPQLPSGQVPNGQVPNGQAPSEQAPNGQAPETKNMVKVTSIDSSGVTGVRSLYPFCSCNRILRCKGYI